MDNNEVDCTVKNIIDRMAEINELLQDDVIKSASKKELREYLMLVDKLKSRLEVSLEDDEEKL